MTVLKVTSCKFRSAVVKIYSVVGSVCFKVFIKEIECAVNIDKTGYILNVAVNIVFVVINTVCGFTVDKKLITALGIYGVVYRTCFSDDFVIYILIDRAFVKENEGAAVTSGAAVISGSFASSPGFDNRTQATAIAIISTAQIPMTSHFLLFILYFLQFPFYCIASSSR